jgi:hypothetical protein
MKTKMCLTLLAALAFGTVAGNAEEQILTVAVFDFESTDKAVADLGPKVATLVNASLSADPRIITVERAELEKALGEQEMGLSGTIKPETAAKVGHLTGAKVLVTGRVFTVDRETMIVTKIIGTETSRVYGEVERISGNATVADAAVALAKKIADTTTQKAVNLVAKVESPDDRIARLKKMTEGKILPVVSVSILERHVGHPAIDPAAETEIGLILQKVGFKLLDKKDPGSKPEVEITGEAFSEFGMRKGNLVSCRGRVELKAADKKSGQLLFVDRQTSIAVDLSEQIAGKTALQMAAQELAERMIPKTVK